MILTLQDFSLLFSREHLLLVMSFFALINLFLMARVLFRRRRGIEQDVEGPLEMVDDGDPILIDVASLEDGRLVRVDGEGDTGIRVEEGGVGENVQVVSPSEGPDGCKYCTIFKDLSSIVCPNCGRLLMGTPQLSEPSLV